MAAKIKKQVEQDAKEVKYDIGTLRQYSRELFGVDVFVFDGAFYGSKGKYTKEDAKDKIKTWLSKGGTK